MKNKLFCNRGPRPPATDGCLRTVLYVGVCLLACVGPCLAGEAPQWMHAVASAPLPTHDEKTDAVLLYSEHTVSV